MKNTAKMTEYPNIMDQLLKLPACTLLTTGRTGSDYFQSLLDSHPQVLTFNGIFYYHTFWKKSKCVASGSFELDDFLTEFIGHHIEKFKTKYDLIERKNFLGKDMCQSISIDVNQFRSEVKNLLEDFELNSRNLLLAICAAYATCLGHDISKKTLFFHHVHNIEKLDGYLQDFPDSKIIVMTRDPRANFVSGVEHWRHYDSSRDIGAHLYLYLQRILFDAEVLNVYPNEYIVIKVEDMGDEWALRKVSQWLGILYHECQKESTWGGLSWHGDILSVRKAQAQGTTKNILENSWETRLSRLDKYVLNFIMCNRLKHYGYKFRRANIMDVIAVFFSIFIPLSYELRFFSFKYLREKLQTKNYRIIAANVFYYFKRVVLCLRFYFRIIRFRKFEHPFIRR